MKADVKCGVACHGGGDNDHVECPNCCWKVQGRDVQGPSSLGRS